jgi:hypothetical protein
MATKKLLAMYNGDVKEIQTGDQGDDNTWIVIKKTADQTIASNITLANDNTLFFTLLANSKYFIRIKVFFSAPATPGFKFALSTGAATLTLIQVERRHRAPATTAYVIVGEVVATPSTAVTGNATSHGYLEMDICLQVSGTGGVFGFQWAQNASSATGSIVRGGSLLEYVKM